MWWQKAMTRRKDVDQSTPQAEGCAESHVAEEGANKARVPDEEQQQQEQEQLRQRERNRPRLRENPKPDDMDMVRLTRSASAPIAVEKPGRLQTFVAGLVTDVEEYVRRGGYTTPPDEVGETASDPGAPHFDYCSFEQLDSGQNHAYLVEPADRSRWAWLGGNGWGGGRGRRRVWLPVNGDEMVDSPKNIDSALLSETSSRSSEGDRPTNDRPQDLRLLRARSFSSSQYGGNSVGRTVVAFLKSMLGSYVLYLPRMFAEGGMVFTAVAITLLGVASTYNMLLLIRCRETLARRGVMACSYGEVGYAAIGRAGRIGVDVSLFLSQLGYCIVYIIFVDENLGPLLRRAFPPLPSWVLSTAGLTLLQACVQVPLSWVRRLKYLGVGMLLANVFIFSGLFAILVEVAKKLAVDGVAGEGTGGSITLINPGDCLILLGAAVGCFEGIGLVLPIEDAMDLRVRDRLPAAIRWSMASITVFFIAIGACGYLAYGREVQHFITMDLPEGTVVGTTVRIMYSIGLILTSPLQLFPAVKVAERVLWPDAPNGAKKPMPDYRRKWLKNVLRACLVGVTVALAMVAGDRFDSFIGIVGGVCAVPLALVYPCLFFINLSGRTGSRRESYLHWGLLFAGVLVGAASTIVAIQAML